MMWLRSAQVFRTAEPQLWLRAWAATTTSVFRRASVRDRRTSPITRLYRLISTSTKARIGVAGDLLPIHPTDLAMNCRCRSRYVGAVSAALLGAVFERGGTMAGASG
jgi:hypothetical protein